MAPWTRPLAGALDRLVDRLVDRELRERHGRLELDVNEYGYDRWGASREDTLRALALMRLFYRRYFRVAPSGL